MQVRQIPSDTFIANNGRPVRTSIFDIGVWNMDATTGVTVDIGIDASKIIWAQAWIYPDVAGSSWALNGVADYDDPTVGGSITAVSSTNIRLERTQLGKFDSVSYDDAIMNRGYISVMHYVD